MKALKEILEHSRYTDYINVPNPPYMPISIEKIGIGPNGLPAYSIMHYGIQNGDVMRDPEMCFELLPTGDFLPFYFRNDYTPHEIKTNYLNKNGEMVSNQQASSELLTFAADWSNNLYNQGFVEAAKNL